MIGLVTMFCVELRGTTYMFWDTREEVVEEIKLRYDDD